MKILLHSADPECHSGYGNVGRDLARRLRDSGHVVRYGTKHDSLQWRVWEGIEVFTALDVAVVNKMIEDEGFDFLLSFWDIWTMEGKRPFTPGRHVAWVPVDTEVIASKLITVASEARVVIAMSQHGVRELTRAGLKPLYIPLGFDSRIFRIDEAAGIEERRRLRIAADDYVIGSVGLNYGDDRKGFEALMCAFARFHDRHPKSILYLHTWMNESGRGDGSLHLRRIADVLGITEWMRWPDQDRYECGRISPAEVAAAYNAMDVFCLPTKGEGFGVPIVEAQACGVPVLVTATTSGPELCRTGLLIEVDRYADFRYVPNGAWRLEPRPDETLDALEKWCSDTRADVPKAEIRRRVLEYENDEIWAKKWVPFLASDMGLERARIAQDAIGVRPAISGLTYG